MKTIRTKLSESKPKIRVGVAGYSEQKFDKEKAKELIKKAFDEVEESHPDSKFSCVSGLTDLGIPSLAYKEAVDRGWETVGIAAKPAEEYDLFPVDEKKIVGEDWGDESDTFLNSIDVFVKIGGGEQSKDELNKAKEKDMKVIEYELKAEEE